jgi:hypothetical protein
MTIMVAWGRRSRHPLTPADVGWTLLAVALTAVGTVRAADWLAALCLMAAAAAARAGRGAPVVPVADDEPARPRHRRHAGAALGRARDAHRPAEVRAGRGGGAVRRARAAGVRAPARLGRRAFSRVVEAVTPEIAVDSVVRWIFLFAFGTAAAAGAFFLLVAPPPEPYGADPRPTRLRLLDWALPTGVLVAVLALFVGVQFVVLFGSDDYVLRTTGLTYAEYARSGFWQLLAVTALALGMLALGSRWAPARTPAERIAKRGLLAALALLTLVVVASAINRMWLYQQAYGFTVLRLLVLTCELWLGAGFLLAWCRVLRLRPGGLSRPMVAVGMLALLGLAVLDAERFIAAHNVARWSETGKLDTSYLGTSPPTRCPRWSTSRPPSATASSSTSATARHARRLAQHQRRPRGGPRRAGPPKADVRRAEVTQPSSPSSRPRATAWVRLATAQLLEHVRDVPLDRVDGDEELLGDGPVGRPLAISVSTSCSRVDSGAAIPGTAPRCGDRAPAPWRSNASISPDRKVRGTARTPSCSRRRRAASSRSSAPTTAPSSRNTRT